MTKEELQLLALKQRIGELVSEYETHIAALRAEITLMSERVNVQEEAPAPGDD